MTKIQDKLIATLDRAAERLRDTDLPGKLAAEMEELARQVGQPCVVAVVGQVKVGKSTFVNALLGEDLAKVGTTETTATINYFSYGTPDPTRPPVRCHWRGGGYTDESKEFLDSLQGNDLETLRRAAAIDRLEYFVANRHLTQITLVDTPGTMAVVDEHQNVTAEFLKLDGQMREPRDEEEERLRDELGDRHHEDTRRLGKAADAVIYLIGPVARAADQEFVEEFNRATGDHRSSSLNAIGVMSKIELQPGVVERRLATRQFW